MVEPSPIAGKGYTLVKDWDFGENILDLQELRAEFHTRYIYANGTLDHLNDEWTRYRDKGNHEFGINSLKLIARLKGTLDPGKIESGMIRSKSTFQYGYFEIRCKIPDAGSVWPAFWLNPEDKKWPPEFDILEHVNNSRWHKADETFIAYHEHDAAGVERTDLKKHVDLTNQGWYKPGNTNYGDNFHTFALEWTPGRGKWYIDGVLVRDQDAPWLHKDGTDGGPAHVLANLGMGGAWATNPTQETPFPIVFEIDYIRVWQRPPKNGSAPFTLTRAGDTDHVNTAQITFDGGLVNVAFAPGELTKDITVPGYVGQPTEATITSVAAGGIGIATATSTAKAL